MKFETFNKRQAERLEKFVAKRETAKDKHNYIIANANGELWFGDTTALSRVVCDDFNKEICGNFSFLSQMLESFKNSIKDYTPANVTEGTSKQCKKVLRLSTPYGESYINAKLLPELPKGSVYMVSNVKTGKVPVWVIYEDVVIGLVCPILGCDFMEA